MRGLKLASKANNLLSIEVAPHTGAWIEISISLDGVSESIVAPHTGAWIEIEFDNMLVVGGDVAPHTGAWIEIAI